MSRRRTSDEAPQKVYESLATHCLASIAFQALLGIAQPYEAPDKLTRCGQPAEALPRQRKPFHMCPVPPWSSGSRNGLNVLVVDPPAVVVEVVVVVATTVVATGVVLGSFVHDSSQGSGCGAAVVVASASGQQHRVQEHPV